MGQFYVDLSIGWDAYPRFREGDDRWVGGIFGPFETVEEAKVSQPLVLAPSCLSIVKENSMNWYEGQIVNVIGEPDDPQWTERFGSGKGIVVNPMGKHSRWVIVEMFECDWKYPIGSQIRFPKTSLKGS